MRTLNFLNVSCVLLIIFVSPGLPNSRGTNTLFNLKMSEKEFVERYGTPALRVPNKKNSDGFILLYENKKIDTAKLDLAIEVNADSMITHAVLTQDTMTGHPDKAWYKDTLHDLKTMKSDADLYVGSMPGFNYFDRTTMTVEGFNMESETIFFGSPTEMKLNPRDESVLVFFKIPY